MQSIVSDTTTLIILGKLGRYDLLGNIFSKIYIPQEVMKEVNIKSDGVYEEIEQNSLFETKEISDMALFSLLDGILDKGESEAIVLAKELSLILLIDEKKGRGIAKNMGLDIIGLLGILILNLKKSLISNREALVILEEIKGLKFRISQKLEESFLNMIGL
jgi:predicted nucleic acid-binding protein